MRYLYDTISHQASKTVTRTYSTSFSLAIALLDKSIQQHIYNIYGFVRIADEIVDTFHDQNKAQLLQEFTAETWLALERKFSLNPLLMSFQETVNAFKIDHELIRLFLKSMEMDLGNVEYDQKKYEQYIVGSAEVVGLMCLKVFCFGNQQQYEELTFSASRLGAAFQKINFLRDVRADYEQLGRNYFPNISFHNFTKEEKRQIEIDIEKDFRDGFEGIKRLPKNARFGVYVAYVYYFALFRKIQNIPHSRIMVERISIPKGIKYSLFFTSYLRNEIGWL